MPEGRENTAGDGRIAVIVPVRNAGPELGLCLDALLAAGLPPAAIVVVDDASNDDAAVRAAAARQVRVVVRERRGGPAAARNAGVAAADRADILFFVDADVMVAPDALERVRAAFGDPTIAAVFGSYDAEPAARATVSRYRNLLHHFVHQEAQPEAWTFWAGCGAIRRTAFLEVGGFDERWKFVEDIELGYRLSRAGWRIRMDKELHAKHLKRWTLVSMVRTDIVGRARPWSHLLFAARGIPNDLNVSRGQRASVALSGVACTGLAVAPLFPAVALPVAVAALLGIAGLNLRLLGFFRRVGGNRFAAACFPLHVVHLVCGGLGFAWAWTEWQLGRPHLSATDVGIAGPAERSRPGRRQHGARP